MENEAAAQWVAVDALHEWEQNPRKNDGEPVARVAASIKRLGWGAPIVARENGEIIAGHARWKAAKQLGLDRVPVRYLSLDPAEAKLMALADNRLSEFATWDMPMVADLLSDVDFEDVDLVGLTQSELEKLDGAALDADAEVGKTFEEKLDGFVNAEIKQVALLYSSEEYDQVIELLDKRLASTGAETYSNLVKALLEQP